jgi:hypothetical protein
MARMACTTCNTARQSLQLDDLGCSVRDVLYVDMHDGRIDLQFTG